MEIIKEHTAAVIIAAYLIIINIVGYIMAYADKRRAKGGEMRISEPTLFFVSLIGGSVGMYAAMKRFHHKTKQKRFMIGIPLMIAFQLALAAAICACILFV